MGACIEASIQRALIATTLSCLAFNCMIHHPLILVYRAKYFQVLGDGSSMRRGVSGCDHGMRTVILLSDSCMNLHPGTGTLFQISLQWLFGKEFFLPDLLFEGFVILDEVSSFIFYYSKS